MRARRLCTVASFLMLCVLTIAASPAPNTQPDENAPMPAEVQASAAPSAVPLLPAFFEVQEEEGVEQVHAKKLNGSVHMAMAGSPLALVLIEECDSTFGKVLASTRTDHYGNFELKPGRRGKVHYLRLSAPGFATREYEVILAPDAPELLKLELYFAAKTQSVPVRRFTGRIFET